MRAAEKSLRRLLFVAALCASNANAQCLTSSQTGTHNGYYYSFWKDSGESVSFCTAGGRYTSQVEQRQQLGRRQGLESRRPPDGDLLRHLQSARQRPT